jgi:hypothetical protein
MAGNRPPAALWPSLRPVEKAIADSRRVSQGTLSHISAKLEAAGPDATLADLLRSKEGAGIFQNLIDDGVVTAQERAGYLVNGELTAEAKTRISQLLLGRFFSDPAQMERIPTLIKNKIERASASLASIEGHADWNLSPHGARSLKPDRKGRGKRQFRYQAIRHTGESFWSTAI